MTLGAIKFSRPIKINSKLVYADCMVLDGKILVDYKKDGMNYSALLEIPWVNFEDKYPKDHTPLLVELDNGNIDRAYYVGWSNTLYFRSDSSKTHTGIKWYYIWE
jgi:hypothetical protein